MKLSFKMKMKLSLVVASVFIIALVIHEDHAGVVLKKFKPRRAIMADLETKPKVDASISTKKAAISKNQVKEQKKTSISNEMIEEVPILRNSTDIDNKTVAKLETIGKDLLLNSSVVYEISNDTVLNSNISKPISDLSKNLSVENNVKDLNRKNSNCSNKLFVGEKDQNCSITQLSTISNISSDISETKENSSRGQELGSGVRDLPSDKNFTIPVSDVKTSNSFVGNKSDESQQDDFQQSLNFEAVSDTAPRNETKESQTNIALKQESNDKLETQSISNISQQLSDPNNVNLKEKPVDKNLETMIISNATIIGDSVDESVQVETEQENTLSQQENDLKIASVSMSNNTGPSDSESLLTNETLVTETEIGLESIVSAGLDFLAHSEVAKNAAVAMEIFNLSDSSLTDHIIDDPDSVINLVLPSHDDQNPQNKTETATALSETKNDLNINKTNESHVNSSDELQTDIVLLPIVKKKCPAPGICVFWFMARNTCTNDNQCLGSKMCCRVRCSKQCIDV